MNKQEVSREASIGVNIEFTNQELRLIKNKWSKVSKDIHERRDEIESHSRVRVNELAIFEMTVLIDNITEGVATDDEIHNNLFVQQDTVQTIIT